MSDRFLLIISNPRQAAFRLRWASIMPQLAKRGISFDVEVRPRSPVGRYRLARKTARYPAVIIQRKLLEPWEARAFRKHARRLLFDVDDAVMFQAHKHSPLSAWRQNRRLNATARALDLAVVGNEYIKEQFTSAGCRECWILPTVLDVQHYLPRVHERGTALRLVWIGSRSTLPYLINLVPSLEVMHGQPHDLQLIIIADAAVQSKILPIRHIPWSESVEAAALAQGDIGIAPTPSTPWARGKCGFKILQYMASALPVIASPVGANSTIVREGITGILANDPAQWSAAITRLGDPVLRQRMGDAGRDTVVQEYSLSRAVDLWSEVLKPLRHVAV